MKNEQSYMNIYMYDICEQNQFSLDAYVLLLCTSDGTIFDPSRVCWVVADSIDLNRDHE